MTRGHGIILLGTVAVGAVAMSVLATAEAEQPREYHFEQQDLGAALRAIGRISGREVIFESPIVDGKQARRLDGQFTAEEAIASLLKDTDLVAIYRNGAILIRGRFQPSDSEVAGSAVKGGVDDTLRSDILVTGSRIRGAPSTSPVVSQTREEIKDAGITDLGGYARTLTQNFSGGQNPGVSSNQGFRNGNLNNSTALNLRGLGADATLTLINGHRVAYDGVSQGVDISAIPIAAIERVEIVADGASALYGTDAVGGVANVLLRRDFVGLFTSARLGASTDGGNEQQQYSAVTGNRWTTGGFMATLDYTRVSEISARDRSYTTSLDDSATLIPRQKQLSFVLAGHQNVASGIRLEIDGQYNYRKSANALAALSTSNVFTNGNYSEPTLTSYTITPTLRFQLPNNWEASLSGTHGSSKSDVFSRIFGQGLLTTRTRLVYSNEVDSAEATAEGPLLRLPGGDVRLAIGGGYRSATLHVKVDRTFTGGRTTRTEDTSGSRGILYGYGELSVPLVGPGNAIPLVEDLRLNGAVRYERYKNIGDVAAPKIGLIYKPHDEITIRASWGKSFKAPTLYQTYQVRYGNIVPGSIFIGFPANRAVLAVAGGNNALQPERATTWTASMTFEPSFVRGLKVDVSYYDIQFRNRVVSPLTDTLNAFNDPSNGALAITNPTAEQLADAIARLPQGATNYTGQPSESLIIGGIVDGSLQNAARQSVKGVDLALQYRLELGEEESLLLTGSATYQKSEQQLASSRPVVQLAGVIFNPPHWRGRVGSTYQRSNVSFSAFASYIGGTLDNRLQPFERVRSFTTLDAIARMRTTASSGMFHGLDATIAVTNLLNEKPDIIRNNNPSLPPYDTTNYPVAGRVISLTVSKSW